jgi:hypothetical protein
MDPMDSDYYDTPRAARYVGAKANTLEKWRVEGIGPPFCKVNGRLVKYRKSDLDAYMASCLRSSTSDSGTAEHPVALPPSCLQQHDRAQQKIWPPGS